MTRIKQLELHNDNIKLKVQCISQSLLCMKEGRSKGKNISLWRNFKTLVRLIRSKNENYYSKPIIFMMVKYWLYLSISLKLKFNVSLQKENTKKASIIVDLCWALSAMHCFTKLCLLLWILLIKNQTILLN